jgi:hypothetical protein
MLGSLLRHPWPPGFTGGLKPAGYNSTGIYFIQPTGFLFKSIAKMLFTVTESDASVRPKPTPSSSSNLPL